MLWEHLHIEVSKVWGQKYNCPEETILTFCFLKATPLNQNHSILTLEKLSRLSRWKVKSIPFYGIFYGDLLKDSSPSLVGVCDRVCHVRTLFRHFPSPEDLSRKKNSWLIPTLTLATYPIPSNLFFLSVGDCFCHYRVLQHMKSSLFSVYCKFPLFIASIFCHN